MKYGLDRSVRLYFSISDICEITHLNSDTVILWEEIFPIKPTRNRAGKRVYRQVDLHKIQWVKLRLSQSATETEINKELSQHSPSEIKAILDAGDKAGISTPKHDHVNFLKSEVLRIQELLNQL